MTLNTCASIRQKAFTLLDRLLNTAPLHGGRASLLTLCLA